MSLIERWSLYRSQIQVYKHYWDTCTIGSPGFWMQQLRHPCMHTVFPAYRHNTHKHSDLKSNEYSKHSEDWTTTDHHTRVDSQVVGWFDMHLSTTVNRNFMIWLVGNISILLRLRMWLACIHCSIDRMLWWRHCRVGYSMQEWYKEAQVCLALYSRPIKTQFLIGLL